MKTLLILIALLLVVPPFLICPVCKTLHQTSTVEYLGCTSGGIRYGENGRMVTVQAVGRCNFRCSRGHIFRVPW